MANLEQPNHARSFLTKAQEYLASAEADLAVCRYTVAAGNAIHAGISAREAIVTEFTGATAKGKEYESAAKSFAEPSSSDPKPPAPRSGCMSWFQQGRRRVRRRPAARSEAEPLVRRARNLVELAVSIVRLGTLNRPEFRGDSVIWFRPR